jgi:hypothetical protein
MDAFLPLVEGEIIDGIRDFTISVDYDEILVEFKTRVNFLTVFFSYLLCTLPLNEFSGFDELKSRLASFLNT